ncbi:hypothetical protein ACUH7Y_09555 [Clostridium beijerinckii]|uniref:Uncharacterized protein n=1 Tax=Clostridium beijerinckii TaxID=1520 RepID=A0A7X9SMX3_CLOBE|nr:hypothetical protein [Clostridium beijerinckii]NMF04558.1 hypothetical protein [Clostridium beijerinckii]
MKVSRNELKNILEVNLNALKQIERRKTLDKRLLEKGYKLIRKYIQNNKIVYELQQCKTKQIINKTYNVKKADNFIDYFNIRTKEEPNSIEDIANKANINKNTVIKWDNTLQDKRIISKDGYYYFRLDKDQGQLIQVSQEEYKSFWRNKAYINAFRKLQDKYIKGEISLTELQLSRAEILLIISTIENKYYYKIKKYKVNKDNKLYIDTKNLIEGVR